MMNITVLCIGKLKEKYWQDACAEYLKRLSRFAKVTVRELSESKSDDAFEESSLLLDNIPKGSYVIALDVGGKSLSSKALAERMNALGIEGKSNLCFIIGGSNGFDDRVREAAALRLSFSAFTFPHQLIRVILLEQLYRSYKINANEKYHK